ncbi:MAG: type ISP restriction/modification enzyme [Planctomycetota bacterium]|nr:type ISP restriction/modification enzyme [Planctomycetota bacterium]
MARAEVLRCVSAKTPGYPRRRENPTAGEPMTARIHHAELWGKRQAKYDSLNQNAIDTTQWTELQPTLEYFFFVPKDTTGQEEYSALPRITEVFPVNQNGLKTDRDGLFFDFDRDVLLDRIRTFYGPKGLESEFKERYKIEDSSSYKILEKRGKTKFDGGNLRQCLYRPFDVRCLYYAPGITSRPASAVMRHMLAGKNLAILTCRQQANLGFYHALCSKVLTECCAVSLKTKEITSVFPLYLYPDPSHPAGRTDEYWPAGRDGRRPNLNPEFVKEMEGKLGLNFVSDGCGDLKKTFGPEDVFHYMYAVFHNPTYRSRYAEFLKIDFPRLPLTSDVKLFVKLCGLGEELVGLHLLESPALAKSPERYPVKGDDTVARGYPKYVPKDGGRVQINTKQYFEPVNEEVWEFHVGGYQVCQKWLKDRR